MVVRWAVCTKHLKLQADMEGRDFLCPPFFYPFQYAQSFNSNPFVEEIEMQGTNLFIESFPVNTEALPELTAYKLATIGSNSVDKIGRKLSYRAKDKFGGHWNWDKPAQCLLTDKPQNKGTIDALLKELWEGQDTIYTESLESIERIPCNASTKGIADFVAQALLDDVAPTINKSLLQHQREQTKYFIKFGVYSIRVGR